MNRVYHYDLTAAVVAEALVARGVEREESARIAILVARSDAMVDHSRPDHYPISLADKYGRVPVITQVYPGWATRIVMGGGAWPIMAACHKWHFDKGNGWRVVELALAYEPDLMVRQNWLALGAHLHTAQDTDGPHAPYTGYPSEVNYYATPSERLDWYEAAIRIRKGWTWGHMLDPEADKIERCRGGATYSARRLFALVSGKPFLTGSVFGSSSCPTDSSAVTAARSAYSDKDLGLRARRIFQFATGEDLPGFAPFEGDDLVQWWGVVR